MAPPFIACTDGSIAVACDEEDGDFPVRRDELALNIKAALSRQSDVEHQAIRTIRGIGLEKLGDGRKQPGIQDERSQQTTDWGPQVWIIVDNQDGSVRVHHRCRSRSRADNEPLSRFARLAWLSGANLVPTD
jgi:hypothetical protein